MSEDSEIYIVCGRCMVKISGPTTELVNASSRGHEKEVHGYMTGQEFYERFRQEVNALEYISVAGETQDEIGAQITDKFVLAAKRAAGLEASND